MDATEMSNSVTRVTKCKIGDGLVRDKHGMGATVILFK